MISTVNYYITPNQRQHEDITKRFPILVEYYNMSINMTKTMFDRVDTLSNDGFKCIHKDMLHCDHYKPPKDGHCEFCDMVHNDLLTARKDLSKVRDNFMNLIEVIEKVIYLCYEVAIGNSSYVNIANSKAIGSRGTKNIFNNHYKWDIRYEMKCYDDNHLKLFVKMVHKEYVKLLGQYNNIIDEFSHY